MASAGRAPGPDPQRLPRLVARSSRVAGWRTARPGQQVRCTPTRASIKGIVHEPHWHHGPVAVYFIRATCGTLCIDAHCFIFGDLPGDIPVLAAPESALGLDRCNTSLSLSLPARSLLLPGSMWHRPAGSTGAAEGQTINVAFQTSMSFFPGATVALGHALG